jgi:predicted ArsR family transcriptional regulator
LAGRYSLYSLTEQGEALFPRAYDATLTTLLDGVRHSSGTDGVVELFRAQWERSPAARRSSSRLYRSTSERSCSPSCSRRTATWPRRERAPMRARR